MSKLHRVRTVRGSLRGHALFGTVTVLALYVSMPAIHARAQEPRIVLAQASLDCTSDVKAMQEHRMKLIDEFNKMAKSHGGKLDPIESCPKLKVLAELEESFKKYMIKNKDWCNVPDQAITNVTESQAKTAALATKVCNVAAQYKKQQAQQAAGIPGAPAPQRLPSGPL